MQAWKTVVQNSGQRRYFGVYFTGMAQVGTGNWAVLPDSPSATHLELITLEMLFQYTRECGY